MKELNRMVYFHVIDFENLFRTKSNICYISESLKDIAGKGPTIFEENNTVIEIIHTKSNYCFGSLGKLEDFENKPLTQSRSKDDINDKKDITEMKYYIEQFTYFCIDLSTYDCAVLNNQGVPSFRKYFKALLVDKLKLLENYTYIDIADKLSNNINKIIGDMSEIVSFTFAHEADNLPINNHLTMGELGVIDSDLIKRSRVSIRLDDTKDTSGVKEFLSKYTRYKENYSEFTIESKEQVVDVIKNILTKKASIPITDDALKSQDLIYKELKLVLLENQKIT